MNEQNGWNDGDTSIQITQTRNTSIKSIYLDFGSFIYICVLWHNDVTRRSKNEHSKKKSAYFPLAASVSSSLDVSFAHDGCGGGGGDGGVCVCVAAATMPSILYYLTRMETKRRWSCHTFRVT